MLDPKKLIPPIEVIQTRREAILIAARDAQAQQQKDCKPKIDPSISVPPNGFPISFATSSHALTH